MPSKKIRPISCIEMGIITNILGKQFDINPEDEEFTGAAQQILAIGQGLSDNNVDSESKNVSKNR
jgi:hypothetical protein